MDFLSNLNLNSNQLQNAVIQPLATPPSSPTKYQIYTNSTNNIIYQYNGTTWKPVGAVFSQENSTGAVITGLEDTGGVTTTNVISLTLDGYAPVAQGYVNAGMTLEAAIQALDTATKASVAEANTAAQNAKASELAAKASETIATNQADIATQKANEASISATNALNSEDNAKASENAAKLSETNAKNSEDAAKVSEDNAKASETSAASSANTAKIEADRATAEADRAEATLSSTQVKIATIDQELTNHANILSQVNIDQEATQRVTGHENILSFPKNAANGQANFGLQGMTAQNLVKNGDFSQGTTGWAANASTITTSGNELSVTSAARLGGVRQSMQIVASHLYYIQAFIKADNSNIKLSLYRKDGYAVEEKYYSGSGNYEKLDFICSTSEEITAPHIAFKDSRVSDWTTFKVKEVMAIDLTALFGAGNEPDVATCDKMFANWFDGMKSVQSRGRVKSVGKNLFDITYFDNNKVRGRFTYAVIYKLKPNTSYTLSSNMPYYDPTSIYFNGGSSYAHGVYISKPKTTITDKNGNLQISIRHAQDGDSPSNSQAFTQILSGQYWLQLEENTVATPYEPYISTSKYLNSTEPLRRVPNGVCDEIRQRSDGGTELVRRCKEYVLQASDVSAINTTAHTYKDYITIPLSVFNGIIIPTTTDTSGTDIYTTATVSRNGLVSVDLDDGVWYHFKNSNSLIFSFPKGTYADLAAAQTALAGTKIVYQLATPIITPIDTSGTLLSYPSGSVYWEPITADAGAYNNGMSILATGFPIATLETLSKVDFVSGVETNLDVSTAVIALDGLSFTHPDLVDGDIVFFTYGFSDDAPQGNKTFGYYDSRYVIKDTVTSKFYQWGITVADGVPAFDLVEV